MRAESLARGLTPAVLLAPVVTGCLLALAGRPGAEVLICSTCTAALVPTVLPWLLQRPFDPFHPLAFVSLSVLLGTTLRSFYVVFVDSERAAWLLDGRPVAEILTGAHVVLAATTCIGAGYWLWGPRRLPLERVPAMRWEWSMNRLRPLFVVVAIGATLAAIDFLRRTGFDFDTVADLSTKRRVVVDADARNFASLGYHRWAAHALVVPLFYMFLIQWLGRGDRRARPFALISGLLAIAFPFLTSDRSGIGFLLLRAFMVVSFVRRISYGKLLLVGVAVLLLAAQMREWRVDARSERLDVSVSPVEALLGNRNFTGVIKTGRIYTDTPERMEREHGKTFMLWTIAWIPRTLWTAKPEISLGDRVTREIYGHEVAGGYPPGLVGELIINFGLLGVLLGSLAYGSALRLFYNTLRPVLTDHPTLQLVYLCIVIEISFVLMGLQVARIVMLAIRTFVTLGLYMLLVGAPPGRSLLQSR